MKKPHDMGLLNVIDIQSQLITIFVFSHEVRGEALKYLPSQDLQLCLRGS